MNDTIISAIIAASVAFIGFIFTYITTRQQLKIKQEQLNLERKKT